MSGKDNNKNNNNIENVGKGGGVTSKQTTWQEGRGKQYAPQVRKQPGEVPMLRFGQPNSFYAFKEAISKAAVEKYGHDGTLFETGVLYKPVRPNREDYDDAEENKYDEILFIEDLKGYARRLNESKAKAPMIYGYVWKFLSIESQDEVKHHADYITFNAA